MKYNAQVKKNNAEVRRRNENSVVEMEDDSTESTGEDSEDSADSSCKSFIDDETSSELSTSSSEKKQRKRSERTEQRKKLRTEGAVCGTYASSISRKSGTTEKQVQDWNFTLALPKMAAIHPNEIDASANDSVYLQMMEAAVNAVGDSIIITNGEATTGYHLIAVIEGGYTTEGCRRVLHYRGL